MNAMWQLATDDIHWVNVVGMHWHGKAEVQKAHQV
jgi:ketosteroid isomerase-like protein